MIAWCPCSVDPPDTLPMAVHRGRTDLLEEHLRRDPDLLTRSFSHEETYPPKLDCHADHSLALHGAPLNGAPLLHLCVEYRDVTPLAWGQRFHDQDWVSKPTMRLIAERGGQMS